MKIFFVVIFTTVFFYTLLLATNNPIVRTNGNTQPDVHWYCDDSDSKVIITLRTKNERPFGGRLKSFCSNSTRLGALWRQWRLEDANFTKSNKWDNFSIDLTEAHAHCNDIVQELNTKAPVVVVLTFHIQPHGRVDLPRPYTFHTNCTFRNPAYNTANITVSSSLQNREPQFLLEIHKSINDSHKSTMSSETDLIRDVDFGVEYILVGRLKRFKKPYMYTSSTYRVTSCHALGVNFLVLKDENEDAKVKLLENGCSADSVLFQNVQHFNESASDSKIFSAMIPSMFAFSRSNTILFECTATYTKHAEIPKCDDIVSIKSKPSNGSRSLATNLTAVLPTQFVDKNGEAATNEHNVVDVKTFNEEEDGSGENIFAIINNMKEDESDSEKNTRIDSLDQITSASHIFNYKNYSEEFQDIYTSPYSNKRLTSTVENLLETTTIFSLLFTTSKPPNVLLKSVSRTTVLNNETEDNLRTNVINLAQTDKFALKRPSDSIKLRDETFTTRLVLHVIATPNDKENETAINSPVIVKHLKKSGSSKGAVFCSSSDEKLLFYQLCIVLTALLVVSCICQALLLCCCYCRKRRAPNSISKSIETSATEKNLVRNTTAIQNQLRMGNLYARNSYDGYWIPNTAASVPNAARHQKGGATYIPYYMSFNRNLTCDNDFVENGVDAAENAAYIGSTASNASTRRISVNSYASVKQRAGHRILDPMALADGNNGGSVSDMFSHSTRFFGQYRYDTLRACRPEDTQTKTFNGYESTISPSTFDSAAFSVVTNSTSSSGSSITNDVSITSAASDTTPTFSSLPLQYVSDNGAPKPLFALEKCDDNNEAMPAPPFGVNELHDPFLLPTSADLDNKSNAANLLNYKNNDEMYFLENNCELQFIKYDGFVPIDAISSFQNLTIVNDTAGFLHAKTTPTPPEKNSSGYIEPSCSIANTLANETCSSVNCNNETNNNKSNSYSNPLMVSSVLSPETGKAET